MNWEKSNCPNCNSRNFCESVHAESCPDCGYEFSYGGQGIPSGGNAVCEALQARKREEWLWEQHEQEVERMTGGWE